MNFDPDGRPFSVNVVAGTIVVVEVVEVLDDVVVEVDVDVVVELVVDVVAAA